MYNKVPPAFDSVGVNSKEKFGIFIFFTMLLSLSILVSEIAIMPKLILVDLIKYSRSLKFLFKGCVRYIFASLFFKSEQEHLSN